MTEHEAIEQAIGEARKALILRANRGQINEESNLFLFAASHPSRMMINGVWICEDGDFPLSRLDDLKSFFETMGHDFSVYIPSGFAKAQAAFSFGRYQRRIEFPTMKHNGVGLPGEMPDDVAPVSSRHELDEFIAICAECFEFSKKTKGVFGTLLSQWTPGSNQRAYIGRIDGLAVACSMVVSIGRYAVIDLVATRPEFRRRGLGRKMTEAAMVGGLEMGASQLILHASADGSNLYRSIGFRDVGSMMLYSPISEMASPNRPA
jgi:Acetyltransferase (GNAT) domain